MKSISLRSPGKPWFFLQTLNSELQTVDRSVASQQFAVYSLKSITPGEFGYNGFMSNVTQLLDAASAGDRQAAAELWTVIYDELRNLAAAKMANERADHTLDTTGLVHEAYLRLIGDQQFQSRGHFFAAAAEAMRRILVDYARRSGRLKRGGDRVRLELLDQARSLPENPDLILSLDDVLTRLEQDDSAAAQLARLHLFGGLPIDEAGEAFGISRATAYRNWKYARAWLREALGK